MSILQANAAAMWINARLRDTSASYYTLLAEAANKYKMSEEKIDGQYIKLFGAAVLSEVK